MSNPYLAAMQRGRRSLIQRLAGVNAQAEAAIVRGQLAQVQADYGKTLVLLAALKAGEITLDEVSLTEGGWTLVDPPPPETSLDELRDAAAQLDAEGNGEGLPPAAD